MSNSIREHRGLKSFWMRHTCMGSHWEKVGFSFESNSDIVLISNYCIKHTYNDVGRYVTFVKFWSTRITAFPPLWVSVLSIMYEKAPWRQGIERLGVELGLVVGLLRMSRALFCSTVLSKHGNFIVCNSRKSASPTSVSKGASVCLVSLGFSSSFPDGSGWLLCLSV